MRRAVLLGWMVCLLCLPVPTVRAAPAKEKSETSKSKDHKAKPKTTKANVVRFTIKGDYPEGPTQLGLFGDLKPSLAKMIGRMDQAAEDKDVAAVWLRIEAIQLGRGKIHELRSAVRRLRTSGKPVYAELAGGDPARYLLAAACDEIIMPPSGTLILPGVRAEITFYKGLLDKLGIEFDLLQLGKYKGVSEPFTRTNMSKPLRESLETLVDDAYERMVEIIAADRRMKDHKVKTLLDQGLFTAAAAKKAGLIDRVVYADQFQESLRKKLRADEINVLTNYKKKRIDADFSGLTGMMKLVELFLGGKPSKKLGKEKKIAVVYAVGPIVLGKSVTDIFGDTVVGSSTMVATLRKAAEDPKVAAIVFRIDSPGGSATASDLIWRETVRIKKPIIASMGDVAGSGGYYIAMGAENILAEPGTITGSIGVVGGKLVTRGLYEKIGLTSEVISRGEKSGLFSPSESFTPEQRKACMAILRDIYRQFVRKAAQGRKLSYKELDKLAQGRIYSGRMAVADGLIDRLGTLQDAITEAKKAAGMKAEEEVELLILPRPKTIFQQLFGDSSLSTDLESVAPELLESARKTRLLRRLFAEPVLTWMPYGVQLR